MESSKKLTHERKIQRKPAPYTEFGSIFFRLKSSAAEHGYKGFLGIFRHTFRLFKSFYFNLLANIMPYDGLRVVLHRARGVNVGKNVLIGSNVTIDNIYPHLIYIGNNVSLAGNNLILAHSKPLLVHKKYVKSYTAPVIIENNVWITVGVIVLAGVRIGEGSIVAAGSVVTRDIPPNSLAAGIPAKVIRKLELEE